MDESEFQFEKLAYEMAVDRLQKAGDSAKASETAAQVVKEMVFLAVANTRAKQDPQKTLRDIFRGVIRAVYILQKNAAEASVAMLQEIPNLADRLVIEFSSLMTWAMEGIASAADLIGQDNCRAIRQAIEAHFTGAGEVFEKLSSAR